ncbi:PepSY domain-containing protein [Kovacikia minuta CCNUW1]|uniref:PepSY-associated TM helix domain-containing protein n=1 Tax=Kovacikia minuta TaxID=2931930 RepID=UPI001CCCA553|nr:PepSY-associated TM helix domain-containing protein [Kovacikia minuta]UBF26360.1 PepSY domain-containing protein [Kovacikia minuta CCNUW1]
MRTNAFRNWIFKLHRTLGLVIGLVAIVVGLTGSALVFQHEMNDFLMHHQVGRIVPTGDRLDPDTVLERVKANYAAQPEVKFERVYLPAQLTDPYKVAFTSPTNGWSEIIVHPYTGAILKSQPWDTSFFGIVYRLHYALLFDQIGTTIVGVIALLMCILTITGIVLWPGWRKLLAGFKIKWAAHPKRISFDLHKVTGILAAVFLFLAFFTGFCWNFYDFTKPLIYAATLTPVPKDPVSQVVVGKAPIKLHEVLKRADAALPGTSTVSILLPEKPEGAFTVRKRFPGEVEHWGRSEVAIDQYSGAVLQVSDKHKLALGDAVMDAFAPLHYGTFGGLPTRIFYVFVGLAPLILGITGFVMWWYRWRRKKGDRIHQRTLLQSR